MPTSRPVKTFPAAAQFVVAAVVIVVMAGGCGRLSAAGPTAMPTYSRTELLYLLPQPYSRLYVEVDIVEGVRVPQEWLDQLEAFLRKYCSKPDGIVIARDDLIPQAEVRNSSPKIVANLYTDGPPGGVYGATTAYMHILFYDSRQMAAPGIGRPHVSFPYTCTIYFDVSFANSLRKRVAPRFLKHEVGHTLGLTKNLDHGDGAHCSNHGCLMQAVRVSVLRTLIGLPPKSQDICSDGRADITANKVQNPATKMSFNGPFLIRREKGYWVASLAAYDLIASSKTEPFRWQDHLAEAKRTVRKFRQELIENPQGRVSKRLPFDVDIDSPQDVARTYAALVRAAKDPNPSVQAAAQEGIEKLDAALDESASPYRPAAAAPGP